MGNHYGLQSIARVFQGCMQQPLGGIAKFEKRLHPPRNGIRGRAQPPNYL